MTIADDPTMSVMIAAAHAGGVEIRRFFRRELTIRVKSHVSDLVTQADIASEAAVLEQLRAAFPLAGIKSEEAGVIESRGSNEWFILDPLDGTHNFSLGVPTCGILIARMQPWGTLTHGVIYEPLVHATFAAAVGAGAWHVETRSKLAVSQETDLGKSVIHYACGYRLADEDPAAIDDTYATLRRATARVTSTWGSVCDLPVFARGLSEGLVFDRSELHDVAAGLVLAREAGGLTLTFDGQPASDTADQLIIAANDSIARQLVAIVQPISSQ